MGDSLDPSPLSRLTQLLRPDWSRTVAARRTLAGALVVLSAVAAWRDDPRADHADVVVTTRDLSPGTELTADDIRLETRTASTIPEVRAPMSTLWSEPRWPGRRAAVRSSPTCACWGQGWRSPRPDRTRASWRSPWPTPPSSTSSDRETSLTSWLRRTSADPGNGGPVDRDRCCGGAGVGEGERGCRGGAGRVVLVALPAGCRQDRRRRGAASGDHADAALTLPQNTIPPPVLGTGGGN